MNHALESPEIMLMRRARTALQPLVALNDHPWMKPPYRKGTPHDSVGGILCCEIEAAIDAAALLSIAINLKTTGKMFADDVESGTLEMLLR